MRISTHRLLSIWLMVSLSLSVAFGQTKKVNCDWSNWNSLTRVEKYSYGNNPYTTCERNNTTDLHIRNSSEQTIDVFGYYQLPDGTYKSFADPAMEPNELMKGYQCGRVQSYMYYARPRDASWSCPWPVEVKNGQLYRRSTTQQGRVESDTRQHQQDQRDTEVYNQQQREFKASLAQQERDQQAQREVAARQQQPADAQRQQAADLQRAEEEGKRREADAETNRLADQILERSKSQDPISQALAEQQVKIATMTSDPALRQKMLNDYNDSQAKQAAQTQVINEVTQDVMSLLTNPSTKTYEPRVDYLGKELSQAESSLLSEFQQKRRSALSSGKLTHIAYETERVNKVKALKQQIKNNNARRTGKAIKGVLAGLVGIGGAYYGFTSMNDALYGTMVGGGILGMFGGGAYESFENSHKLGRENRSLRRRIDGLEKLKIDSN